MPRQWTAETDLELLRAVLRLSDLQPRNFERVARRLGIEYTAKSCQIRYSQLLSDDTTENEAIDELIRAARTAQSPSVEIQGQSSSFTTERAAGNNVETESKRKKKSKRDLRPRTPEPVAPPPVDLTTPVRRSKRPRVENPERPTPPVQEGAATSNKKNRSSKKPAAGEQTSLMTGALPTEMNGNNNPFSGQISSARTRSGEIPSEETHSITRSNEDLVHHGPGTADRPPIIGGGDLSRPPNPPVRPANRVPISQSNLAASTASDGTDRSRESFDEIVIDKNTIGYIYGSQHRTIIRIREQSGADILIQESRGRKAIVRISGTETERQRARNSISDLVDSWTSQQASRVGVKPES